MAILHGPDLWADDPSPEELQRAFAQEQQARTAIFQSALAGKYPATHNGTPNEPERELSAAEVRDILADIVRALAEITILMCDAPVDEEHWPYAKLRELSERMDHWQQRLNDAPPF